MVFKCKMCGGDIELVEGTNTGKCLYCKSTMTLPTVEDERILNLYNRANDLRLENEFDKAYATYESILELDNEQVEAHWGLILCKYGVEYVDDPKTKKKIPTCHRTNYESIFDDVHYKVVKEKSYGEALKLYEKEAKKIQDIQKGILEISSKEEPYDIFICYKETDNNGERTHDSVMAEDIYEALTKEGYKVFFSRITLEDKLGTEYEPYIFSALNSAKVMLVVGTSSENLEAVWVKNEWSRYLDFMKKDKSKTLIPVYSKMDAYKLPESFAMLQAQNMDKVGAMQDLVRGIKKIMNAKKETKSSNVTEEMYHQFKERMEDEESSVIGNEKRYATNVLKEKIGKGFIGITLLVSFLMAIWMAGFLASYTISNSVGSFRYSDVLAYTFRERASLIQITVGFITLISFFIGLLSRKMNKVSKILYLVNFALEGYFLFLIHSCGFKSSAYILILVGLNLILFLLRPRWQLSTNMLMLNKKNKEMQEEKNRKLKEKFVEKEKFAIHPIFYGVAFILLLFIGFQLIRPVPIQSNKRNSKIDQIKVLEQMDLYENTQDSWRHSVATLFPGEIYDVISTRIDEDGYQRSIEIQTSLGVHGYIASQYSSCVNGECEYSDDRFQILPKEE